jgi:hypothetical protein
MIISYVLVALVNRPQAMIVDAREAEAMERRRGLPLDARSP